MWTFFKNLLICVVPLHGRIRMALVNLPPHKFRTSAIFLLSHEVSQKNDYGMVSHSITLVPNIVKSLNCYKIERNTHIRRDLISLLYLLTEGKAVKNQNIVRK